MTTGQHVGTVVGNTSPHEFRFFLQRRFRAKLGDLVAVEMEIPAADWNSSQRVNVWARIVELGRYNPFLPAEAGQELAEEGLELTDTVLSISRDQIEGKAIVLGYTDFTQDSTNLRPLSYPVQPGAEIRLPPAPTVQGILVGDEDVPRLRLGTLLGRSDIRVELKTNVILARHMAILAMTGGGKTVAARRVIRELLAARYPLLVLDPHGDYLGFWLKQNLFPDNKIRLFHPSLSVNAENRDLISYLIGSMTQGLTDAQKEKYFEALESVTTDASLPVTDFIDQVIQELHNVQAQHRGTVPAVRRQLKLVRAELEAMDKSNQRLRDSMPDFTFSPMPDPKTYPEGFVRPGQLSIVYLGGYDHLTQSTIVSLILKQLFEHRASMDNVIPPFFTVLEEAHTFIPSRGEGQAETPSLATIRKVITEGRKFGTGLLLISQRPSRLDETTLSQCNTFLIFRLVNPRDQTFVERVMENLTKEDSRLLPGFGPGQGIISGQAVRFPLAIKVDCDDDLLTPAIGAEDFLGAVAKWEKGPSGEAAELTEKVLADLHRIGGGEP
jgi:uncharacterized protein